MTFAMVDESLIYSAFIGCTPASGNGLVHRCRSVRIIGNSETGKFYKCFTAGIGVRLHVLPAKRSGFEVYPDLDLHKCGLHIIASKQNA